MTDEIIEQDPAPEAPVKKKPRPWGALSGRKRKPGKKRRKGNRKEVVKNWKWSAIAVRVEHYAFLRELRQYYRNASFARIVGTLIVHEYCRILHTVDPVKATAIRRAYESDKYKDEVIVLAPADRR